MDEETIQAVRLECLKLVTSKSPEGVDPQHLITKATALVEYVIGPMTKADKPKGPAKTA